MSLEDDVDLFEALRDKLIAKLDARSEELAAEVAKARDAKRRVAGRGRRGAAAEPGEGTQGDRVLVWLREHPGPHTTREIATATQMAGPSANQVLIALHGAGLIERPWRGVYRGKGPALPLLPPHQPTEAESAPAEVPKRETPADRMHRMERSRGGRT